jgi:GrpB-like predicted nucleotidyltransferase (UPF0157 family)
MIVTQQETMRNAVEILIDLGFKFVAKKGAGIFKDRYFVSGPFYYKNKELHIHFHVTYKNSKSYVDHLNFRDYLRNHPKETFAYQENKKKWMKEANGNIFIFTELKSPYIKKIKKNKHQSKIYFNITNYIH